MTKKLLLGSVAAAFVLGSSAVMAADAPRAPSRTPVWACDITGFWELPGTDICFKVGGFARADFTYTSREHGGGRDFDTTTNRSANNRLERTRFHAETSRLNFDARSNTEYGTVRAFIEFDFAGGVGNQLLTNSQHPRLRHAFVQFGNLLAGQTWSTAMVLSSLPDGLDFGGMADITLLRQAQLRWTQPFGNGVSFSIALENPMNMDNAAAVIIKEDLPDLVANISVGQSWGTVQVSGALREVNNTPAIATSTGTTGWMVNIGGSFNVPIANGNDSFRWFAAYSNGGTRYLLNGAILGLSNGLVSAERNAAGALLKAWSANASFQHFWSNQLRSSLIVGHTRFTNIVTAGTIDRVTTVQGNLIWSPVARLDIGAEVLWGKAEFVGAGSSDSYRILGVVRRSF